MGPSTSILGFTIVIWRALPLLDQGRQLDPRETRKQIADSTIVDWLATQGLELSFVNDHGAVKQELTDFFQRLDAAVGPTKFGVQENGLAILVAYCTQGIQEVAQAAWGTPDL